MGQASSMEDSFKEVNEYLSSMDYLFKFSTIGDKGVGKKHMITMYSSGKPPDSPETPYFLEFAVKTITHREKVIKQQLWYMNDSNQSMSFQAGLHGLVLVYDVTSPNSFLSFQTVWEPAVKYATSSHNNIIVVAAKNDLESVVSEAEAREYAASIGAAFFCTTIHDPSSISAVYLHLTDEAMNKSQKSK